MNIKRIFKIAGRDIRSNMRDFMVLYILFSPFLLSIILMLVAPEKDSISVNFALESSFDSALVELFDDYGTVTLYGTEDEVIDRVDAPDEVLGVVLRGDTYTVIVQGNESEGMEDLPRMILDEYFTEPSEVINVYLENMGQETSILRREGSLFILLFVFVIPGVMIGLNIVEEKEENTISSLDVTPTTKGELLVGKSVFGIIVAFIQLFAVFYIFKYTYVDWWLLVVTYIPGILSGVLIGYLIGAVATDQIGAIAMIKFSFFPMMVSMLGTLFIPERFWWTLYWSPYHWLYRVLKAMIMDTLVMSDYWFYLGLTLGLSILYMIIGGKKAINSIQ